MAMIDLRCNNMILKLLLWCAIVFPYQRMHVNGQGGPNTISTNDLEYKYGESIKISWEYDNADEGDWIALTPLRVPPISTSDVQMWVFAKSLKQTQEQGIRKIGSVTFEGGDPDEGYHQNWPLLPGNYQVFILRQPAINGKHKAVLSSFFFIVNPVPTPAPTPTPPFIETNQLTYTVNDPITITWDYDIPVVGDWIGLFPSPTELSEFSFTTATMWVYISSLTQTLQGGTRKDGFVTFDGNNPIEDGIQDWPLKPGTYKVYILRFTLDKEFVAISKSFTVNPQPSSSCFSALNTVDVKDKGNIAMSQLEIGDYVKGGNGHYTQVYGFSHYDPNWEDEFQQIRVKENTNTSSPVPPFEVTSRHLVFVERKNKQHTIVGG
jgi:Hint module